jgi:hypothetical protein
MSNQERIFEYIASKAEGGMSIISSNEIGSKLGIRKNRINSNIKSLVSSGRLSVIRRKNEFGKDLPKLIIINQNGNFHVPADSALSFVKEKG